MSRRERPVELPEIGLVAFAGTSGEAEREAARALGRGHLVSGLEPGLERRAEEALRDHDLVLVAPLGGGRKQIWKLRKAARVRHRLLNVVTIRPQELPRERSPAQAAAFSRVRNLESRLHAERICHRGAVASGEALAARVRYARLRCDRRDLAGPFDVVGDVHGCLDELLALLDDLGYGAAPDDPKRSLPVVHPEGRTLVLTGDLCDRGPSPGEVLVRAARAARRHPERILAVASNHDDKIRRALAGGKPRIGPAERATLDELAKLGPKAAKRARKWLENDVASHLVLDAGRLVVAHAGLPEAMHLGAGRDVHDTAMYGIPTGRKDRDGYPERARWDLEYEGEAVVAYGHVRRAPPAAWVGRTIGLDTSCVFGGALTALRWPERELVSIAARGVWWRPGDGRRPRRTRP